MASEAPRKQLTEHDVLTRVTALLAADPVCMGKVNKATVRMIAQIVAFPEAAPDGDVLAEREACLGVIAAAGRRLLALHEAADGEGVSTDDVAHEVLRLGEAARIIGLGLHRSEAGAAAKLSEDSGA